jgi:hypothetical protein
MLQGSDVGEPWRTVTDVADWLIWLMFAAEVAPFWICARTHSAKGSNDAVGGPERTYR